MVFAWSASLASRDTTANALWEIGYDKGSHRKAVLAGDTLFAASRVIEKRDYEVAGAVRVKLIGIKGDRPAALLAAGRELFDDRYYQKVFEVEQVVLVPKR